MNISYVSRLLALTLLVLLIGVLCGCSATSSGGSKPSRAERERIFETPQEVVVALKAALRSEDPEQLVKIFGEQGRDVLVTGDAKADAAAMRRLSRQFDQRAELQEVISQEYSDEQWYKIRYGTQGWNMRIPLVNRGSGWLFATELAADAAQDTRRAMNELTAVTVCREIGMAQGIYRQRDRDGDGLLEFAQKILSTPGKRDGLYWKVKEGEDPSPLNDRIAKALEDGYERGDGSYEGYHYKILTAQGPKARGGGRNFLIDGNMTGGFAVVAYPVTWNVSGSYTFFCAVQRRVWQKDLGSSSTKIGSKTTSMDTDRTWVEVGYVGK